MRGEHDSLFTLARNGVEIAPNKAHKLDRPMLPDPKDAASRANLGAPDTLLLQPLGLTPKEEVAGGTHAVGSSLSDHQDRRLKISAIAVLRDDGIQEIRQQLYSPHGPEDETQDHQARLNASRTNPFAARALATNGFPAGPTHKQLQEEKMLHVIRRNYWTATGPRLAGFWKPRNMPGNQGWPRLLKRQSRLNPVPERCEIRYRLSPRIGTTGAGIPKNQTAQATASS